ncbi:MAG TPA: phosphonopyruvate decarboxylase [Chthoniobacteraceae bacterium]|nr:phosphonopyruvate decarboxylase [Chthoniobacteraceae bacterium]
MIPSHVIYDTLLGDGVSFFAGVPDSLLKDICAYITDHAPSGRHVIAANEGAAVALATGWHLATGEVGLVYLQNSGLGNLVNPLTSLADPEVYSIPMVLLIGWRGEPGVPDEPQHRKQGRITPDMLAALEIPAAILPDTLEDAVETVRAAVAAAKSRNAPQALLVRKGTFESYRLRHHPSNPLAMVREDAVKRVLGTIEDSAVVVSTTGMTSREVFEYRESAGEGHSKDFLTVGCMGHASQIAMGLALAKKDAPVYCLDGDGAVLMHMGSLAIMGTSGLRNLKHVVINNGAHDSVGGQPTAALRINLLEIAKACGYQWVAGTHDAGEMGDLLEKLKHAEGPAFLEIRVNKGSRPDLGRPTTTTHENKEQFIAFVRSL